MNYFRLFIVIVLALIVANNLNTLQIILMIGFANYIGGTSQSLRSLLYIFEEFIIPVIIIISLTLILIIRRKRNGREEKN